MTEIPIWAQKGVNPNYLRLRSLPVNWDGIKNLSQAVNDLKGDPIESSDLLDIKPDPSLSFAIPMVASVIARRRNPEIPVIYPTLEQIQQMKPWLRTVSNLAGRIRPNWQVKFDGFVERKGASAIEAATSKVLGYVDQIESLGKDPKSVFINEIALLYVSLATPEEEAGGFFWSIMVEVPIEQKIDDLLSKGGRFDARKYPLLAKLSSISNFPSESTNIPLIAIAGAELMVGIGNFLKNEGYKSLPTAPRPGGWNLGRFFAELFASDKLETVKTNLPEILRLAKEAIPDNPQSVVEKVYEIAENVAILNKLGATDEQIVEYLFAK